MAIHALFSFNSTAINGHGFVSVGYGKKFTILGQAKPNLAMIFRGLLPTSWRKG